MLYNTQSCRCCAIESPITCTASIAIDILLTGNDSFTSCISVTSSSVSDSCLQDQVVLQRESDTRRRHGQCRCDVRPKFQFVHQYPSFPFACPVSRPAKNSKEQPRNVRQVVASTRQGMINLLNNAWKLQCLGTFGVYRR